MAINPVYFMFLAFGVIMGIFILIYFWIDRKSRKRPIRNLGDLLKRPESGKRHSELSKSISKNLLSICPVCQSPIGNSKICQKCGYEIVKCKICSKIIGLDDKVASCPYCGDVFHEVEFLEWLKIKAFCPNCRSELDLWEFKSSNEKMV